MNLKQANAAIFAALALAMALTRLPWTGNLINLLDGSWAVFFLAGFYLRDQWRWAFPALIVEAVAIDAFAIREMGVSNYCVTIAYWFLLPAHGCLWLGGSWLRRQQSSVARGLLALAVSAAVSITLCFVISNGSFYWLGGRVAAVSWNGWLDNLGNWYWTFLRAPLIYIGVIASLHAIVLLARRRLGIGAKTSH